MKATTVCLILLLPTGLSDEASAWNPTPTPEPTATSESGDAPATEQTLSGSVSQSSSGVSIATGLTVAEPVESEPPLEPRVAATIEDSSGEGASGGGGGESVYVAPCEEYVYNWVENIYVLESCGTVLSKRWQVCGWTARLVAARLIEHDSRTEPCTEAGSAVD